MKDYELRIWSRVLKHKEKQEKKSQDVILNNYPKLSAAQKKAIKDKVKADKKEG